MRDFFKSELKTLHLKTGLQQYYKLSDLPDGKEQIRDLLDLLVKECDKFKLIPNEAKKKIVQDYMITDADFQGFNPKILWKWFNMENRKYLPNPAAFNEAVAITVEMTAEERQKVDALLDTYKAALIGKKPVFEGLEQDIAKLKREDSEQREGKKAAKYIVDQDAEVKMERHHQWIRENHDLHTGKPLPCWTEESEWLELKYPTIAP